MLKISGNNKLRVLNFGYVMAVNVTIMCVDFQTNLQVLLKVTVELT